MDNPFKDKIDDDLEEEMSIDELAQNWVEAIPRREGLKLIQLPRDHVKRFLAAATINPGTVAAARALQTRLKFTASVINVPAKSFLELCEAFVASQVKPLANTTNPTLQSTSSEPEQAKSADPATSEASIRTNAAPVEPQVADPADASEGPKTP